MWCASTYIIWQLMRTPITHTLLLEVSVVRTLESCFQSILKTTASLTPWASELWNFLILWLAIPLHQHLCPHFPTISSQDAALAFLNQACTTWYKSFRFICIVTKTSFPLVELKCEWILLLSICKCWNIEDNGMNAWWEPVP